MIIKCWTMVLTGMTKHTYCTVWEHSTRWHFVCNSHTSNHTHWDLYPPPYLLLCCPPLLSVSLSRWNGRALRQMVMMGLAKMKQTTDGFTDMIGCTAQCPDGLHQIPDQNEHRAISRLTDWSTDSVSVSVQVSVCEEYASLLQTMSHGLRVMLKHIPTSESLGWERVDMEQPLLVVERADRQVVEPGRPKVVCFVSDERNWEQQAVESRAERESRERCIYWWSVCVNDSVMEYAIL